MSRAGDAVQVWLSGNEAVARALLEAGVRVVAGYPGGPTGEIVEEAARLAAAAGGVRPHVEWSMNERVALDVASGAAMAGARAVAVMKHFGVNVAADVLHAVNVMGVPRLVLVVGDDPQGHSSHNEQDSRRYATFAQVPCLEPGTPQDAYRAVGLAFGLSESLRIPVMVRLVTSVAYAEGSVRLDGEGGGPRPAATALWTEHGFHGRPVVGNHVVAPVGRVEGPPIGQVIIGSCTNSSYRDLMTVAAVWASGRSSPRASPGSTARTSSTSPSCRSCSRTRPTTTPWPRGTASSCRT